MFYILGLTLAIPEIALALGTDLSNFHLGLVAFGILFTPISIVFGLLGNILSRRNEYQADAYAKEHHNYKKLVS